MQAFSLRQSADYSAIPDLEADTVKDLIREGRAFLEAARDYLRRRKAEDADV